MVGFGRMRLTFLISVFLQALSVASLACESLEAEECVGHDHFSLVQREMVLSPLQRSRQLPQALPHALAPESAASGSGVVDVKRDAAAGESVLHDILRMEERGLEWLKKERRSRRSNPLEAVKRWQWQRSRFQHPDMDIYKQLYGMHNFFNSAFLEEWFAFVVILQLFLVVQYKLWDWPSKFRYHSAALLIWLSLAALCNFLVWWRWGDEKAKDWFSGYMLEFVFSIENVFVFHIVVRAFRVPRRHTQKALMVVVIAQILFEMVFFMGLAWIVRASNVLPYILGVWLLYVGYQAGSEGVHDNMDFKETWVYIWSSWALGGRLHPRYYKGDTRLFLESKKGAMGVTLLLLATVALVVVDFLLEVDVVLTKIEELQNHYLAFTSSAAAAFAVPELFFVSRDLFARFYLLKFGIGFILMFFGFQLLFHDLVALPTLVQISITLGVMVLCALFSTMLPIAERSDLDADESEEYPLSCDGEEW